MIASEMIFNAMIRGSPTSAKRGSSAASDVYKRQRQFWLQLDSMYLWYSSRRRLAYGHQYKDEPRTSKMKIPGFRVRGTCQRTRQHGLSCCIPKL